MIGAYTSIIPQMNQLAFISLVAPVILLKTSYREKNGENQSGN